MEAARRGGLDGGITLVLGGHVMQRNVCVACLGTYGRDRRPWLDGTHWFGTVKAAVRWVLETSAGIDWPEDCRPGVGHNLRHQASLVWRRGKPVAIVSYVGGKGTELPTCQVTNLLTGRTRVAPVADWEALLAPAAV